LYPDGDRFALAVAPDAQGVVHRRWGHGCIARDTRLKREVALELFLAPDATASDRLALVRVDLQCARERGISCPARCFKEDL